MSFNKMPQKTNSQKTLFTNEKKDIWDQIDRIFNIVSATVLLLFLVAAVFYACHQQLNKVDLTYHPPKGKDTVWGDFD